LRRVCPHPSNCINTEGEISDSAPNEPLLLGCARAEKICEINDNKSNDLRMLHNEEERSENANEAENASAGSFCVFSVVSSLGQNDNHRNALCCAEDCARLIVTVMAEAARRKTRLRWALIEQARLEEKRNEAVGNDLFETPCASLEDMLRQTITHRL
jgi:hypothetical protein